MNIQDLGALGELIGSVAVVITLIYLASQLRQNTKALKLNAEYAAAQEHVHNSIGVSGTNVPYVMVKGFGDPTSLSPEESAQFLFWLNGSMRMYQHQHLMFCEGNLSEASWSSTEHLIKGFSQTPGFQSYWESRKNTYSDEFQAFVEELDSTGINPTTTVVANIQKGETGDA